MRKPTAPTERELAFRARLGRNILDAAVARDLSIHALAREANVSRAHLSFVLRGTANCSVDWLVRMADVLGVEPHTLLAPKPAPEE